MNMFARFDENPAMTLQNIKETKRYGRTDARTHGRMDNVKTVYPPQTKFAGGIIIRIFSLNLMICWENFSDIQKATTWHPSVKHLHPYHKYVSSEDTAHLRRLICALSVY